LDKLADPPANVDRSCFEKGPARESAAQQSECGDTCVGRGFAVVRSIAGRHHASARGKCRHFDRQTHERGVGLSLFNIVAAGNVIDQIVNIEQAPVDLERRALAIGRYRDRPTLMDVKSPRTPANARTLG
jgi:hypothetical protein